MGQEAFVRGVCGGGGAERGERAGDGVPGNRTGPEETILSKCFLSHTNDEREVGERRR